MSIAPSQVVAVAAGEQHGFRKPVVSEIRLLPGLGVEGDAHCGVTVKHRSRVKVDPTQPNLRQVHLLHVELHRELATKGFVLKAGEIGENILTEGIDLLGLVRGSILTFADGAAVEITGLRNPCAQLDRHHSGLLKAVLDHDPAGNLIRKAGVMGIVRRGGPVRAGSVIGLELPPKPWVKLDRV